MPYISSCLRTLKRISFFYGFDVHLCANSAKLAIFVAILHTFRKRICTMHQWSQYNKASEKNRNVALKIALSSHQFVNKVRSGQFSAQLYCDLAHCRSCICRFWIIFWHCVYSLNFFWNAFYFATKHLARLLHPKQGYIDVCLRLNYFWSAD